ncbi:membrane protein [Loktanella sp. S4079]|uniref:membrane protein n=1 Tax=Loktanella sp. S4079 TaxID=579483 RepID=UPI0005FA0496|nr:membrane protein [Loktanella sp. S4079]KJZ20765.1 membrane protein [Loktanella sp. S4079]
MVVILVIMPSLIMYQSGSNSIEIVGLFAIFAAVFTAIEYASKSPSLVEFRDAPPFNRVRFSTLFATVLCLSVIFRGYDDPSLITEFFQQSGSSIGETIDFPYSPVRLMVLALPQDAPADLVQRVRDGAGLSYLVSIFAIVWFVIVLRLRQWPRRDEPFNVWVNLPTFDPSASDNVVHRLERDGRINVILGFLLPFLVPAVLKLLANLGTPVALDDMHTLVWMITAWAFLPASILMRGVALSRVAQMIRRQREMAHQRATSEGVLLV